ncbi:MAG: 4Fe-4S binding protein [Candidatus Bathyarchaeota archaeon]|nr:4Fe-4S binding protein [Candidatus Bathyarchaeum sp.]
MVVTVKIDYSCCTGCRKCVEACDYGVIEWFEDQPIVTNPINCSACSKCKLICPVEAISVKK